MDDTAIELLRAVQAVARTPDLSPLAVQHLYAFVEHVADQPDMTDDLMKDVVRVLTAHPTAPWTRSDAWALAHRIGDTIELFRQHATDGS